MTRSDFRDIVEEYAKAGGASFIDATATDKTAMNNLIDRGLKSFTRYTYALYDPQVPFTTATSERYYGTSGCWWVENVVVNTTTIRNRGGRPGPESFDFIFNNYPGFQTDSDTAKPTHWIPGKFQNVTGQGVYLYPGPDGAYQGYFSGYMEHATVGSDSTELDIEEHVIDLCAMWCAMLLKFPHAEGEILFNQIMTEDQIVAQRLKVYRDQNRGRTIGNAVRKGSSTKYNI